MKAKSLPVLNISNIIEKARKSSQSGSVLRARAILNILKRDNFKCVTCGSAEELTIAHLEMFRGKGRGRSSLVFYRLNECKTQCVRCHLIEEITFKPYTNIKPTNRSICNRCKKHVCSDICFKQHNNVILKRTHDNSACTK